MKKILAFFMAAFFSLMALGCTGEQAATQAKGAQEKGQGSLIVKMLDIGQGDALLIKTAKETILLDSGDVDKRDDIVKLLKKENVKAIDKLIITHPHADHLGGAYAVLKNFTVKSVYDNGQATTNKTYTTYLKLIKEQNIPYKSLRAGDKIDFGGSVQFEVLNPTDAEVKKGGDINSNSIVGLLTYGKFAMLTTGDCEASREKEILEKYGERLKADILKSPHHGSKTSSNRNYLKAIAPKDVIISCGKDNEYGHPHKETVNKYKDMQINIYRTDVDGTITIESDGETYKITKER